MFTNKLLKDGQVLIKDRRGFALLELVIALSLLSIILAMGFMFYFFGVNTFGIGEQQTDVQQNARLAADFITRELRIAEKIVIVDQYEDLALLDFDVDSEEYLVYYLYVDDSRLYYEKIDTPVELHVLLEGISSKVDFDLEFIKSATEENILHFNLSAENKESGRNYSLETEVLVLNLDEIEDFSSGQGKAVFYQIPAPPNPTFRGIQIEPQSHTWNSSGTQNIDVNIQTINVPDGADVKAEFFSLADGTGGSPIESAEGAILNNSYSFMGSQFTVSRTLDFGYYYIQVTVESDGDDQFSISQRRYYYINPVVIFKELVSRPGNPHLGTVKLETGGIPQETNVIRRTTAFVEEDYYEDLNIALVDGPAGSAYRYINYEFHQTPTWSSGENGFSNLSFGIKVDDPADVSGDIYLKVVIGKYEPMFFNLSGDIVFESLKNLSIEGVALDPPFDSDIYEYSAAVAADVTAVEVMAELQFNEGAILKINGLVATSGVPIVVTLNSVEPAIIVEILSEVDNHVLRTYNISITYEEDNDS